MRGLLTTLAVVVQLGGVAGAQPDPGAAEGAAQIHLDRGVEAFHAHDYAQAHHEFSEASRLAPERPNPYRWLALTEVQLGACPDALGHIEAFLARVPSDDKRVDEMIRLRVLCSRVGDRIAPPVKPPAPRPITSRWWFWTAIGGAVATIAVTAIVIARDDPAGELPTLHCDMTGCVP